MAPFHNLYRAFGRLLLDGKELEEKQVPYLTRPETVLVSSLFTIAYVLPLYLSRQTRPSTTLSRDAPSVIRARIRLVSVSVMICGCITAYILSSRAAASAHDILHHLGIYPINITGTMRVVVLTALLFSGPLFERIFTSRSVWHHWYSGRALHETLSSYIGWRNYIVAPVTEEILFRGIIVTLHLLARPFIPIRVIILVSPLYFGIAHVHHFYEFTLTHPYTPWLPSLLRSLVQFTYTSVFGWYATFLFLRSGSLWALILVHSLCNWIGLPRIWGRLEICTESDLEHFDLSARTGSATTLTYHRRKDDSESTVTQSYNNLHVMWSLIYYILLVVGALLWWKYLFLLTENGEQGIVDTQAFFQTSPQSANKYKLSSKTVPQR